MHPIWKAYLVQSLAAAAGMALLLLFVNVLDWTIITALGSTAFVLFATPHRAVARPRNTIAGHCIGLTCGSLCALVPHTSLWGTSLIYALAVGLAIFVMLLTDTEQPPAAGTALSFAIRGFSLTAALATLLSVVLLALIHQGLRPHLHDLVGRGNPPLG